MSKIKLIIPIFFILVLSVAPSGVRAIKDTCPVHMPTNGPTAGEDLTDKVPTYFPKSDGSDDSSDGTDSDTATTVYNSAVLGRVANPGGNGASATLSGNCHGYTPCHKGDISGHGVYKNRNGSQGDAIDIVPANGKAYAAFDGTAYVVYGSSEKSSGNERDGGVKLVSKNRRVAAYYYHTLPKIKSGQEVTAGAVIATTGASGISHIHFELLVDGKSVHGSIGLTGNPGSYMQSLWANIKKVLGI